MSKQTRRDAKLKKNSSKTAGRTHKPMRRKGYRDAPANDSELEVCCDEAEKEQQHEQVDTEPLQQPGNHQRDEKPQQQQRIGGEAVRQERIVMETSNATSLNTNRETALARKAHFQAIQEACLNEAQVAAMKTAASLGGKTYIGGPTDPEQGKAVAGVGLSSTKTLAPTRYQIRLRTISMR